MSGTSVGRRRFLHSHETLGWAGSGSPILASFQRFIAIAFCAHILVGCGQLKGRLNLTQTRDTSVPELTDITGVVPMYVADSGSASAKVTAMNGGPATFGACSAAEVRLHELRSDDSIDPQAIASAPIGSDGRFRLESVTRSGVKASDASLRHILVAEGCGRTFYRPVTQLGRQDITLASTLICLAKDIESSERKRLSELRRDEVEQMLKELAPLSASSLTDLSSAIASSETLSSRFQTLFNVPFLALQEAPPAIERWTVTAPESVLENTTTMYSASVSHWNSEYVPAFEWVLDGTVVSSTASYNLSTNKNSQGSKNLVLRVGSRTGSILDPSKPVRTQVFSVTVQDTYPAIAPPMSLMGAMKRNYLMTQVSIDTGASLENCATFSRLALTESTLVAPVALVANFPITCANSGTQLETLPISQGDGNRSVALWALDASGKVSQLATSTSFVVDATAPQATLSTLASAIKGGSNVSVAWSASDATAGLDLVRLDYAADGATYIQIANLLGAASPFIWSVPLEDRPTAKLRLRVTDQAGNSTIVESAAFVVDSTAPVLALSSPAANTKAQSGVTVTGSCEAGLMVAVTGDVTAPSSVACSGGNFSAAVTVSAGDGPKTITFAQTDAAGNSGSVSRSFVKDATPPVVAFVGPTPMTQGRNGLLVSGTCEAGLPVSVAGTGIGSQLTANCPSGTFSQSLVFSGGDGTKNIVISQTDEAGNTGSANRDFVRSATAPALSVSSPSDNGFVQAGVTVTGNCENEGSLVSISGSDVISSPQTVACAGNLFSKAITLGGADGAKAITVAQTDSSATLITINLNLTKDTQDPSPSISTPAVNTPAQSLITLTGSCENGLLINFAGSGIGASESLMCASGMTGITCAALSSPSCAYSKMVTLSANDGTKNITVSQTDQAGNTGIASRDFVRDNVPPSLTLTSHANGEVVPATVTLAGSCEAGASNVTISSSALSSPVSVACSSGTYNSGMLTLNAPDGSKTVQIQQSDAAGNTGTLTTTLVRDTTPPLLVKLLPADNASYQSTATISGMCESGLTVTASGTGLTGNVSDTCLSSAFSINVTLAGSDGSKAVTLTSTDSVGNTSTLSFTLVRDNVAPALTQTSITQNPRHSNTSSITFGGACESGLSVIVSGAENATRPCTSGAWTFATNKTSDGTYSYSFTQTDQAGNSTTIANRQWIRDTVAPSMTWASPADGVSSQTQFTASGTCETGINISFSGTGLVGNQSIPCSSGTFSHVLYYSSGDGLKSVTVGQTDLAGNTTSVTKSLYRDETAPAITQTLRVSPYEMNTNSVSFGGACETGLPITVQRGGVTETTTLACSAQAWTYNVSTQTTDGSYSYVFSQTDAAGNTGTAAAIWIRDTVAPIFTIDTSSVSNAANTATFSGSCQSPLSISVSGADTATTPCTLGAWSYTTASQTLDGTRNYTFVQTDRAGNATTVNASWTRSTVGPKLTIMAAQVRNGSNSATFTGACENGLSITVAGGVDSTTATCSSGAWTYTTSTQATDGSRNYTFAQTNSLNSLTTTVSGTWIRDTTGPTVQSVSLPSSTIFSPYAIVSVSGADALSRIKDYCLVVNSNAMPDSAASCWTDVTNPGLSISGEASNQLVSYASGNHTVYAWLRDELGNVSSSPGQTAVTYSIPPVPELKTVLLSNSTVFSNGKSEREASAGTKIFIKWTASGSNLPSQPIALFFTVDDTNWTLVANNLANGSNGGCVVNGPGAADDTSTGCFEWTAPVSSYFRVRVSLTDSNNIKTFSNSLAMNVAQVSIIAGNTESGLNGSANAAVFLSDNRSGNREPRNQMLAINQAGKIYINDYRLGILTIDPGTGLVQSLISKSPSCVFSDQMTPIAQSCLKFGNAIALDRNEDLLVFDGDRIRIIYLSQSPIQIETLVGGGNSTATNLTDPKALKFNNTSALGPRAYDVIMKVLPNNDIVFTADNLGSATLISAGRKLRRYSSATKTISYIDPSGTGFTGGSSVNIANCGLSDIGFTFTPGSTSVSDLIGFLYRPTTTGSPCISGSANEAQVALTRFNSSFVVDTSQKPHPAAQTFFGLRAFVAASGKLYAFSRFAVFEYVPDAGAGSWVRRLGTTTTTITSFCSEGTIATSCQTDSDDVFVTRGGDIFFISRGMLRMVDSNNRVKNVFGLNFGGGSGSLATDVRLNDIAMFDRSPSGNLAIFERASSKIYEMTEGSVLTTIMGNGTSTTATASSSALAVNEPLPVATSTLDTSYLFYNGSNQIVLAATGLNRVNVWDRALRYYTVAAGGGANSYRTVEASGVYNNRLGVNVSFDVAGTGRVMVVGSSGGTILAAARSTSGNSEIDTNLVMFDSFDGYRMTTLMRQVGTGVTASNSGFCADGTSLLACTPPSVQATTYLYSAAQYSSVDSGWLLRHAANKKRIVLLVPGGVMRTLVTLQENATTFRRVRAAGRDYLIYCSETTGRLRRADFTNVNAITEQDLPWPIPSMSCTGRNMAYDENNGHPRLLFHFIQTGLEGIAEHTALFD